jgi:hypothetical protein
MPARFYGIDCQLALSNARPAVSLDDPLRRSDAATLYVPEIPQTEVIIGTASRIAESGGNSTSDGPAKWRTACASIGWGAFQSFLPAVGWSVVSCLLDQSFA